MSEKPKRRMALPPLLLLAALATMLALHMLLPLLPLPPLLLFPWRATGAVFGTAGVALVLWAGTIFTRVGTAIHPLARSSFLVRSGPFRFSRNPIYLGMVLILSGAALALGSAAPWLIIPVFIGVIVRQVIAGEERKLTAEFGAEYLEYCTRVRRWL